MYLRNKTTSFKLNFLSQWCYFRISLRFSLYLDVIYEQQLKLYLKGPCCLSSERVIITYRAYTYQFKRTFIKKKKEICSSSFSPKDSDAVVGDSYYYWIFTYILFFRLPTDKMRSRPSILKCTKVWDICHLQSQILQCHLLSLHPYIQVHPL
uniref:Uncharacterized protein n=1 Tax=Cacopsylla melanoneura TaxID=428564 RepID=A0A8D8T7T1_9HEMI